MKATIQQLKPTELWGYFHELTQIPRPSGYMEPIQQYMTSFGEKLGLKTEKDASGNIIIKKAATTGLEHLPPVVLQSHLDMVPQKNSHFEHDFTKDPIVTRIEDGWVKATNTTLGSDNGIGVAAIMAVLASDTIKHGPIEGLFTIDEETGMDGAFGLNPGSFQGRTLINLDSEHEGDLFVGCAGGINVTAELKFQGTEMVPDDAVCVQVALTGLKGGHSGVDIHLGRGNANKLLFHFLKLAVQKVGLRLVACQGGTLRNAIPREAFATVVLPEQQLKAFEQLINEYEADIREAYAGVEESIQLSYSTHEKPNSMMPAEVQDDLINAVVSVHDGVLRMIPEMPAVVETSSNLAIVQVEEGLISCLFLARSASEFMKQQMVSIIQSAFSVVGAKVAVSGDYPGWMPDLKSHIMDVMVQSYKELYHETPAVNVIHAGLECGIIQDRVGKMEMISFGPNISSPHSPDEKVEIASVERFFNYLVHVLSAL